MTLEPFIALRRILKRAPPVTRLQLYANSRGASGVRKPVGEISVPSSWLVEGFHLEAVWCHTASGGAVSYWLEIKEPVSRPYMKLPTLSDQKPMDADSKSDTPT